MGGGLVRVYIYLQYRYLRFGPVFYFLAVELDNFSEFTLDGKSFIYLGLLSRLRCFGGIRRRDFSARKSEQEKQRTRVQREFSGRNLEGKRENSKFRYV